MTATTAQAKQKSAEQLAAAYTTKAKSKTAHKAETKADPFAEIKSNPLYAPLFKMGLSPNEMMTEIAKVLASPRTKDETKAIKSALEQMKAFLQENRKDMARQIISLTDTDIMAEVQRVYQEINDSTLDFEEKMEPITNIIEALYRLRENDIAIDVYAEIKDDKKREAELASQREAHEASLQRLQGDINRMVADNTVLGQEKTFFGFSGPSQDTLRKITLNDQNIADKRAELDLLRSEIEASNNQADANSAFGDFAAEKAALREMLDLTSDEHTDRQRNLVDAANTYIDTTEERVAKVLSHLDGVGDQADRLERANHQIRTIYAVLGDATVKAQEENQDRRKEIAESKEGASDLDKLAADNDDRVMQDYIGDLNKSHVDTTMVLGDLTEAGERIRTMKENTSKQDQTMRSLHTMGVAGIADQLSTSLQAISGAALGEAASAAQDTMKRMRALTTDIGNREAFRVAAGITETNENLQTMLDEMHNLQGVIGAAHEIRKSGLEANKELMSQLKIQADEAQKAINKSRAEAADITASVEDADSGSEGGGKSGKKSGDADPFGIDR